MSPTMKTARCDEQEPGTPAVTAPEGAAAAGALAPAAAVASPPKLPTLRAEVRERTGINVATCYQCGKCSAGCPMAGETGQRPHDIVRLVMRDKRDALLGGDGIWLCVSCETCTARCPNGVDPARVIDTLREIAIIADPDRAPRAIRAFHQSFLDQIRLNGRMYEFGLVMQYKMRTGNLLQDVSTTPGLITRGKLHLKPSRIKGLDEVRRIFKNVEAAQRSDAAGRAGGSHSGGGER